VIELLASAALHAMASVGVNVKLTSWRTNELRVTGLKLAPEWREYIVERKQELVFQLMRRDRRAWREFSAESLARVPKRLPSEADARRKTRRC